jgi:hypothetical protein
MTRRGRDDPTGANRSTARLADTSQPAYERAPAATPYSSGRGDGPGIEGARSHRTRNGPPLHIHFKEHEEGTVIAGTLAAAVDGVQVRIEQSGLVQLPMGSAHRWWNGGTETLELMASQGPSSIWTAFCRRHST